MLTFFAAQSQNVGYMGKKISIETAMNVTPSVLNIMSSTRANSKYYLAPNIGLLYTTSSSTEIGIKLGFENVKPILNQDYYVDYESSFGDYYFKPESRGSKLNYKTVDFVIRNYTRSGYIAPIGTYFQYMFGVSSKITSDSIYGEFLYRSWDLGNMVLDDNYGVAPESVGSRIFRLGCGIGKKVIITDGLFYQFELNAVYNHLRISGDDDAYRATVRDRILYNSYYDTRYIRWDKLIEFKVGIGYMF